MELTAENVQKVFLDCVLKPEEMHYAFVIAEGVQTDAKFSRLKLFEYQNQISEMLKFLPDNFRRFSGGGWTFLNMCQHKDGHNWTDLHKTVDKLLVLGLALDLISYTMPRDMWSSLPGSMPYVSINI